ncbi:B-block binding subunit of TFIIIC [Corchorus olitorius]|uniref:B-block binding subunit of TFIIIC n=1 Tax=Corchorus olitorius TaxID=93759 RepID=A0A1R3H741_9ROSI|nr:B-block binding subunit of TFIIIC [Corchorus olitorius]
MDSIITSALEEICFHGQGGISLSSLCSKLSVSPPLKSSLWKNLLSIPALRFKARTAEFLSPSDDSIQCVEDAEKLEVKILADEKLRNNFVGLYDENVQISSQQRRTLERLAIARMLYSSWRSLKSSALPLHTHILIISHLMLALENLEVKVVTAESKSGRLTDGTCRTNGVTQSQLAKEFGIEGKNFFYILKNLECRGLIVKQPAVVRKKEPCIEGESKNSSPVTTNLIYLYRYAKRLGSQQRFEINKEEETVGSLCYEDENVPDKDGVASENVKENVLVNDYLPAMKAVCDKLEEANGKVLVVSDIKRDLGYTRSSGHKAWRNIHRRLKDAGLVEDFHAVVNEKVELCLRSVKRFSKKDFDLKIPGFDDQLNKGPLLKFGRTLPNVDQIVELPIDTQIYDIVDAEGSEGLPVMTVCEKLGIDKKRSYPRFFNMFSKFGMHHQAESHKKTTAYRVWTSGNSNPKSCNAFLIKSKNANDENETSNPNVGSSEVPNGSNQNFLEYDLSTSAGNSTPLKIDVMENDPEVSCGSHGETNHIVVYSDNMQEFPTEQSNIALDSELRLVSTENEIRAPPPEPTQLALLKPSDSASCQTYSCQVQTADAARREQRILERLQDEKFILRPELYRWLVELEKDKSTKLDRKTVDRLLKKLQQQGHCKCMNINVPVVTNCGRSRITQVVLHPSVESLHPELLGGIHDRLRSFEMQIRGHGSSKLKKDDSVPVLDGVQRTQSHTVSDAKAAKSEAMRANGFVLAKMVRSKLLHGFLWGFLSSSNGWDDAFSLEKHLNDQRDLHGSCILFSLEAAIKAIPLELFLQIVGSTLKFDDMIEKCKKGFCLSDLPIQEYKLLMDTQATGRLSLLIDILRRLKLIRLVPDESSDNRVKVAHANLTHAMELKPYIEEPLSVISTSTFRSLDLRPRIRHDFILSNREAVDDYWKTLEYCYAAADPRAALHAFPGSAVHEVFLNRSWASVRVMTAEQRAELLKRIVKDNLNEKLSYKHCRKIANDLDLTLEQVLRVHYDKHQKRLNRFRGVPSSIEEHQVERNKQSSARKRKRSSKVKSAESTRVDARTIELDEQEIATPPVGSDGYAMEQHGALTSSVGPDVSQTHQEADNVEAVSKEGTLEEDEECYSLITQYAFPKLKPTRTKRFSWTDGADRELVMRYARYRAALGAKFHRVDWTSIAGLPAPPRACARRITFLKRNAKFRKALMKLCNMLSERYVMHLERNQNRSLNNSDCRLLVRSSSVGFSNGIEHGEDAGFEEERWDDFDDKKIKRALEDALRFKQIVKLEASKRAGSISAEWSNINMNSEDNLQGPEIDSPSTQGEDMGRPGAGRKGSSQSSRNHRFHQKLVKLWNVGNGAGRQVHDSLAVSNAVELFKLVFLSTSTAPPFPNLLAETLRRYSEHDLFAGFSYLRDRKIMIGGTCGQPFVLSQQFLHSISKSPFPRNTGKRAANFSAWLHERKNDLMEGGMNLTEDLQCGDIFHLFSLVFFGELSVFPCLPDEGIGEAEDLRSLKRRAEDNELCDADKAKKLKSIAEGEFVSRREKGFPGIMVSVYSTMVSASNALELFKDETCTLDHVNDESLSQKVNRCSTNSDYMKEMLEFGNNVTIASKSKVSPWDAMASYAEHLLSNPSYEEGSHFDPEIIKAVHAEIQKAGDQGLGIEDVYNHIKVPGGMTPEIIIDTLQAFGRAFKVNAYDSVRVVDALYHSKYFLASSSCFHRDLRPPSSLASQGKDGGNFILQQESVSLDTANLSGSVTAGDVHKVTILNLPEEHALPSNKVPSSNVNESGMGGEVSLDGDNEGEINKPSSCEPLVPILPWINADGTINRMVYNGLIRRVLGTVMQNPGMLEEDIIYQMDVLNPQNCRKLLELMILDRHLIVKKMVQATGSGPPTLLAPLLGSSYRKPKFVSLNHYFANPTSTFML